MTTLVPISDPDDERIAPYRSVRERDLVGRGGYAMAEGTVVLASLLRSPSFRAVSLLILRNRLEGVIDLLQAVPATVPVYVVERDIMDRVVGFPIHRGVLALAERTDSSTPVQLLSQARTALVGIGIANHDNSGALLRNAAAFGVDAVVFDERSVDPLYRKSIRVSAGAAFTVEHSRSGSADELLDAIEAAGMTAVALSPKGRADIRDAASLERPALIVGPEGPGLSATILERCSTARISMAAGHDSLNVATSAAIALYAISQRSLRADVR